MYVKLKDTMYININIHNTQQHFNISLKQTKVNEKQNHPEFMKKKVVEKIGQIAIEAWKEYPAH